MAAGVLIVLLPPAEELLPAVLLMGTYMLAQLAGLASQVPGGLGVFETVFIILIGDKIPAEALLGALFTYRIIYYLLPLALSAALLGIHEICLHRGSGSERSWRTIAAGVLRF